jgi:putative membrane protein
MPSLTSSAAWPVGPPFIAIVVVAALYVRGGRRRVSARRGSLESRGRSAAFYAGLLTLLVAFDSPLDPLAETLFAAHMAQHVLLLTVAPPLVVLSAPWARLWRPFPVGFRRAVARTIVVAPRARPLRTAARLVAHPLSAWLLFDVNLIVWHVPAFYDATLRSQAVHDLEHGLFLFTGLLFWAAVIDSAPFHARLAWLWRAAFTTGGMLVGWLLAVVLAFAPTAIYPAYASLRTRPGGLSALADQQLAAGIMWVPGSIAFTLAIVIFFYRWLDPDPRARSEAHQARLSVLAE